jgi:DNA-binding NarL/FixJ family response regulator
MATNHTEPIYRIEALKRGADAFVGKDRLREELWMAVQESYLNHQTLASRSKQA